MANNHDISKALEALERADASLIRFYDHAQRIMMFQMIAIAVIFLVAIGYVLVTDRKYKTDKRTVQPKRTA